MMCFPFLIFDNLLILLLITHFSIQFIKNRYEKLLSIMAKGLQHVENSIHLNDKIYNNLLKKAAHMLTMNELMENFATENCVKFLWRSFIRSNSDSIPHEVDQNLAMDTLQSVMDYARSMRGQNLETSRVNYVFISALFEDLPI